MPKFNNFYKRSFILVLALSFFSTAFAGEVSDSVDKSGSIYRYNALENKLSFIGTASTTLSVEEQLVADNIVAADNTKKLQDITEKQSGSIEKSDAAITVIEDRDMLTAFLIGNRLGTLRFQMVQMRDQTYVLNGLVSKTADTAVRTQINDQLAVLEKQQTKVEDFILEQNGRFSLFGWLVNSI